MHRIGLGDISKVGLQAQDDDEQGIGDGCHQKASSGGSGTVLKRATMVAANALLQKYKPMLLGSLERCIVKSYPPQSGSYRWLGCTAA
jgi:hypothetical protein